MTQWLLDLFDLFTERKEKGERHDTRMDPSVLPGWSYARALAFRIGEDAQKNEVAITNFGPSIVC
jgi:hypothetical protein